MNYPKIIFKTVLLTAFALNFITTSSLMAPPRRQSAQGSVDQISEDLAGLSVSRALPSNIQRDEIGVNKHTHTPENGTTLYITDIAEISYQAKAGKQRFPVVHSAAKDLYVDLNHFLYRLYGKPTNWRSNSNLKHEMQPYDKVLLLWERHTNI